MFYTVYMWFYYLIFIVLGLCAGSFINVLLYRLDREGGIVTDRSKCRNCATRLKWYDLIPVLSYIFLKARCRYCKKQISILYPIVELSTAAVFLLFFIFNYSLFATDYWLLTIGYWLSPPSSPFSSLTTFI